MRRRGGALPPTPQNAYVWGRVVQPVAQRPATIAISYTSVEPPLYEYVTRPLPATLAVLHVPTVSTVVPPSCCSCKLPPEICFSFHPGGFIAVDLPHAKFPVNAVFTWLTFR